MVLTLGYWDIRGLAAPIRYLLEYAGVQYTDKLYKAGPPPTFENDWLSEKPTLDMHFPNLPYILDGDVKLAQSEVIMRYLAAKHNLKGKTEKDQLMAELLASQVRDNHMAFVRIVYNPQFEELKDDYIKALPDKLKALEKFLGTNKYAVGDYVTYVDFVLFEYLELQAYFLKDLLKDYPVLEQYHKRILALDAIDKYFKSDRAIKYPFNGAPAYFGGKYSEQLSKKD